MEIEAYNRRINVSFRVLVQLYHSNETYMIRIYYLFLLRLESLIWNEFVFTVRGRLDIVDPKKRTNK